VGERGSAVELSSSKRYFPTRIGLESETDSGQNGALSWMMEPRWSQRWFELLVACGSIKKTEYRDGYG
jgi:hypothetical protein